MKANLFTAKPAAPTEPRPIGEILTEMLLSNSPLATGYRTHLALAEHRAEKGVAVC